MYSNNFSFNVNDDDPINGSLFLNTSQSFKTDEIYNIDSISSKTMEEPSEPVINGIIFTEILQKEQNSKQNSNSNDIKEENKEFFNCFILNNNDSINNIDPLEIKKSKKEISQLNKKRQRKDETKVNDNFQDEGVRRKVKQLVIDSLRNYINYKIVEKYNNIIGKGICKKKILIINQEQIGNSTVEYNRDFLYKSIGDIFSVNISTKYTNYPSNHNEYIIQLLMNDKDSDKRNYFTQLFNLTFLDALKHYRGSDEIDILKGLNDFSSYKKEYNKDDDSLNTLEYYMMEYETILLEIKKPRKKRKKNN